VCHEIPVCYGGDRGPDLEEVCLTHGLSRPTLVALHTEPEYLVQAIGFLPGFGYLAGLDPRLVTPRRGTPRLRVPAGSVGIGGPQTGVYPFASPGGWNILGMSPARLFDGARVRPSLLEVGDRVRFVEITPDELLEPRGGEAQPPRQSADVSGRSLTVVKPGLFTTIQDLGRPGYRAAGVPLSGAADAVSLRLANLLVGNREDAAAIEVTLLGPDIRFEAAAVVAVTGGSFPGFRRAGRSWCRRVTWSGWAMPSAAAAAISPSTVASPLIACWAAPARSRPRGLAASTASRWRRETGCLSARATSSMPPPSGRPPPSPMGSSAPQPCG
jgi:hypothetical protein